MKTANEIFASGFQFGSTKEMAEAIASERHDCVNANKRGRLIVFSGKTNLVVADSNGRMDSFRNEPFYDTPATKKELLNIIESLIEHCNEKSIPVPYFEIEAQGSLYYYESAYDKLSGVPAEPLGDDWAVTLIKYQPI